MRYQRPDEKGSRVGIELARPVKESLNSYYNDRIAVIRMFDVVLTSKAIEKVKTLMPKEGGKQTFLRVYVAGGGCGGFKYGLSFENKADMLNDFQVEKAGLSIIVDRESATYLEGTEIDYVDSLEGSGFTFTNPNAKSTCSCGQSFTA